MPEGAAPKLEEPPAATGSNITKFPHELGVFIAGLPPPSVAIGPAPDVSAVIDVSPLSIDLRRLMAHPLKRKQTHRSRAALLASRQRMRGQDPSRIPC